MTSKRTKDMWKVGGSPDSVIVVKWKSILHSVCTNACTILCKGKWITQPYDVNTQLCWFLCVYKHSHTKNPLWVKFFSGIISTDNHLWHSRTSTKAFTSAALVGFPSYPLHKVHTKHHEIAYDSVTQILWEEKHQHPWSAQTTRGPLAS